jgi:hypothetical protein
VQGEQRRALLAEQQDPRGFAVKPMRKFEKARLRPLPSQRLDDPEALAAATMHGDAGRLVDDQQALVFINDRQLHLELGAGHHFLFDLAMRNGGMRSTSPVCRRYETSARRPFTRTWPLRTML